MSKNNEKIINNNFNPSKKRQDFKKHKSYGRCLTIEIPEDKCKDYYPKYANNKTINYSRSYNNFYAFKFNIDKINNNSSVRGNNGNQKTTHVPKINRHKRNLNKFININKEEDNKKIMENKTQINKYNINNKSYSNFNSFYKRKKRYLSNDINETKNYNNNYITDNTFSESNIFSYKMDRTSTNKNSDKINKSLPVYVCQTCFDKEMLEETMPSILKDNRKDILREKFIKQNPFIFIDKMNNFEKRRIQNKVDNMTKIQRSVIPAYELEVNKPRNLKKEKLQLLNEYSLNPLCLEHGKDPKFIKYKVNFDKKEKLIQSHPDIFPGLGQRKAFQDYYEKCMYQVPITEENYSLNPKFKENHIKVLKMQIDNKKKKESEYLKKTKTAECFANKNFEEYNEKEKLKDLKKISQSLQIFNIENKKLGEYKKSVKEFKRKVEEKLGNKLVLLKDKENEDYILRYKKEKFMDTELYQKMFEDMNKKKEVKLKNKKEEKIKWNNFMSKYSMRYGYKNRYNNCDGCNKPVLKNKELKKYPPPKGSVVNPDC